MNKKMTLGGTLLVVCAMLLMGPVCLTSHEARADDGGRCWNSGILQDCTQSRGCCNQCVGSQMMCASEYCVYEWTASGCLGPPDCDAAIWLEPCAVPTRPTEGEPVIDTQPVNVDTPEAEADTSPINEGKSLSRVSTSSPFDPTIMDSGCVNEGGGNCPNYYCCNKCQYAPGTVGDIWGWGTEVCSPPGNCHCEYFTYCTLHGECSAVRPSK